MVDLLPLGLRHALESGECVLFVGAGIGSHLKGPDGQTAPDGHNLAKQLAEAFSIDTDTYDLTQISQIVTIRKGRPELEPISKLLQEHSDARELHETKEVRRVILPANEEAPFPLKPGKEAFDEPATFIPPEMATILGLEFPGGAMGRNQIHALLSELVIKPIAVIGAVPNEMRGLRLQHVEVETELHQGDFMMIRRMRTDGER